MLLTFYIVCENDLYLQKKPDEDKPHKPQAPDPTAGVKSHTQNSHKIGMLKIYLVTKKSFMANIFPVYVFQRQKQPLKDLPVEFKYLMIQKSFLQMTLSSWLLTLKRKALVAFCGRLCASTIYLKLLVKMIWRGSLIA